MILPSTYKDQKIAVLGLGKSGRSAAKRLSEAGANVLAWDDQMSARKAAEAEGISLTDLNGVDWEVVDHLVLSPGIPHNYPAPNPIVARAQIAGIQPTSDFEVLCKNHPQAFYIGVTGTNGKSTTTSLIGHILSENQARCEVGGNLGIPVLELNPLGEGEYYVLEASSYQLEISPSLHCNVSVLLNITPDHLERHGGMEGYVAAKKLIYRNTTPEDTLVISVDDEYCLSLYESLKKRGKLKLIPISVCKVLADGVSVKDGFLYENAAQVYDLRNLKNLKGQHNWQNIAAAFAALRSIGYEASTIIKAIESFPGLAHRQQVVAECKGVTFINDSKATNAEAVSKALDCFKNAPLYCLLGGRGKEGGIANLEPYFPYMNTAFLYGEAAPSFAMTLEGKVPYTICKTLQEATQVAADAAFKNSESDKVVLLSPACASFDQFKDFEERGNVFIETVKKIIEGKC